MVKTYYMVKLLYGEILTNYISLYCYNSHPALNVTMDCVIIVMVHTFMILKSMLLKPGCEAPICWSKYSTCLSNKLYSSLLRYIFVFEKLVSPDASELGSTGRCIDEKI